MADMDKKKAAKLDYKENPPDMGVLQVANKLTGQTVLFGTANLSGKINSVKFQLERARLSTKISKKPMSAGAPDDIEFIVLEVLRPDKSPGYNYKEDLKQLAKA